MTAPFALRIDEASLAGEARRAAVAMAHGLGFDETARGRVALVVTEAATNLVKHAGGGELLLRTLGRDGVGGLELLALDRGPGMTDLRRCLADGYSTAGSPGTGLGAIRRQSDSFDIISTPGKGTALTARLWARGGDGAGSVGRDGLAPLEIGAVCLPQAGEEACGDAWSTATNEGRHVLIVADGLGHGSLAAKASVEAVAAFHRHADRGPEGILRAAHEALRSTRGAAVAVAEIDPIRRTLRFAGVGNVAGAIVAVDASSRSLVSHSGIVGYEMRKVQEFALPFEPGSLLVLHSDGIASQARVDRYPGLVGHDPALVAGLLYRDYRRERDDATVVVARLGAAEARRP